MLHYTANSDPTELLL